MANLFKCCFMVLAVFTLMILSVIISVQLDYASMMSLRSINKTPKMACMGGYVTFGHFLDPGQRLGNQIFNLASIIYVAQLTGRKPAIENLTYETTLEKVFDLRIARRTERELCPCVRVNEARSRQLQYDKQLEQQTKVIARLPHCVKTVQLHGFYQSWKYTRGIDARLRGHLVFRPAIRNFVDRFFDANVPPNWIGGFVRVGIHARRGDVLSNGTSALGFTTPNATYFRLAMAYFIDRYAPRIQFIVTSDDMPWCLQEFPRLEQELNNTTGELSLSVVYSVGHSPGQDLALLAGCDHVIMSTGTFGWWAAWLPHGAVVYYEDWPRNGSYLASKFIRRDFFPPSWVGLDE